MAGEAFAGMRRCEAFWGQLGSWKLNSHCCGGVAPFRVASLGWLLYRERLEVGRAQPP